MNRNYIYRDLYCLFLLNYLVSENYLVLYVEVSGL